MFKFIMLDTVIQTYEFSILQTELKQLEPQCW